jgi:ribosomal protein L37AE/L43A
MSKETKTADVSQREIKCSKCGAKELTSGIGDFSTYVCEKCQEKINLPAYKAEMLEYEGGAKEGLTESQLVRVSFLKGKIEAIEAIIEAEAKEKEEKEKEEE